MRVPASIIAFSDYYFSITDPIGERQKVFIEGNDLQERFQSLKSSKQSASAKRGLAQAHFLGRM